MTALSLRLSLLPHALSSLKDGGKWDDETDRPGRKPNPAADSLARPVGRLYSPFTIRDGGGIAGRWVRCWPQQKTCRSNWACPSVPPSPSSVLDWVRSSASSFLSLSSSPCFPFLLSLSTATFPSRVVFPRGETRINGRLFRDVICPALPSSNSIPSELIPGADLEFASSCSHEEWDRRGWDGTRGEKERAGRTTQTGAAEEAKSD